MRSWALSLVHVLGLPVPGLAKPNDFVDENSGRIPRYSPRAVSWFSPGFVPYFSALGPHHDRTYDAGVSDPCIMENSTVMIRE